MGKSVMQLTKTVDLAHQLQIIMLIGYVIKEIHRWLISISTSLMYTYKKKNIERPETSLTRDIQIDKDQCAYACTLLPCIC